MRKLLTIILLLFCSVSIAQTETDVIEWRNAVTTIIRNQYVIPTGRAFLVWNVDTQQLELAKDDQVWHVIWPIRAENAETDVANFDNILSSSDDTVQKALETLDDLIEGGTGDMLKTTYDTDDNGTVDGVDDNSITAAKLQQLGQYQVFGRLASGPGDASVEDLAALLLALYPNLDTDSTDELLLSGGTMTGDIILSTHDLLNVKSIDWSGILNGGQAGTIQMNDTADLQQMRVVVNNDKASFFMYDRPNTGSAYTLDSEFEYDFVDDRFEIDNNEVLTTANLSNQTGGTDDQTASEVPFTPNGSIAATDVQAAIQEVRDEAGSGSTVDKTFEQITYGATVNHTYDPLMPNIYINLTGDIDLTISSITEGGGLVNLVRSTGTEAITLNGTLAGDHNYATGATDVIRLVFFYENDGLVWYYSNPEGTAEIPFTVGSGRVDMRTDGQWITNADNSYGPNRQDGDDSAGNNADPVFNHNVRGYAVPAGTKITSAMMYAKTNITEITDVEWAIYKVMPDSEARNLTGVDDISELDVVEIFRDNWLTPVVGDPATGAINDNHLRTVTTDVTENTWERDGMLVLAFKATNTITAAGEFEFTIVLNQEVRAGGADKSISEQDQDIAAATSRQINIDETGDLTINGDGTEYVRFEGDAIPRFPQGVRVAATPTLSDEAASKSYVDTEISAVVTDANAYTYEDGTAVGGTAKTLADADFDSKDWIYVSNLDSIVVPNNLSASINGKSLVVENGQDSTYVRLKPNFWKVSDSLHTHFMDAAGIVLKNGHYASLIKFGDTIKVKADNYSLYYDPAGNNNIYAGANAADQNEVNGTANTDDTTGNITIRSENLFSPTDGSFALTFERDVVAGTDEDVYVDSEGVTSGQNVTITLDLYIPAGARCNVGTRSTNGWTANDSQNYTHTGWATISFSGTATTNNPTFRFRSDDFSGNLINTKYAIDNIKITVN